MPSVKDYLVGAGICSLPGLYADDDIAAMNSALDPLFAKKAEERRSYAHPEEMFELGLMDKVFNEKMMNLLFSFVPDPVLYHFHAYEIAGNDSRSHIFGGSLQGWHRDPDSEYVAGDPTHVSVFVYLTHVGPDSGAFEFVPDVSPAQWLHNGAPYISVQGPKGYSFAWHRGYFHRASPNRASVRRRLIKLSVQRNSFHSAHLSNPHFTKLLSYVPAGNERMDVLLGRYQGKAAPRFEPLTQPAAAPIATTDVLHLSSVELATAQLRQKASKVKNRLQGKGQVLAAYD